MAAGAVAARPDLNLNVYLMWVLMTIAAILGDTVNYHLGYFFGAKHPFGDPDRQGRQRRLAQCSRS